MELNKGNLPEIFRNRKGLNWKLRSGAWNKCCTKLFITEFLGLKHTTICKWKKMIIEISRKDPDHKSVTDLPDHKRGRPLMLPEEIQTILKKYIHTNHDAGRVLAALGSQNKCYGLFISYREKKSDRSINYSFED